MIVCLAFIAFSVLFFRRAINPQGFVARATKRKGVDLLANVNDREVYFRRLRRSFIFLGILTLFLSGAAAYTCFWIRSAELLPGEGSMVEYLQAYGKSKDSVQEIGETAEQILQNVERAQADAEAKAAAGDGSQRKRLEALEELHKTVEDLKSVTEKAGQ